MQHNLIQRVQRPAQESRRLLADVLVRRAMESVSADLPLLGQLMVDGVGCRGRWEVVEKGGVEHRDMRHIRQHFAGHLDALHGGRIVQRGQQRQTFELGDDRVIDDGRLVERGPAVHYSVANRCQPTGFQINTGLGQLVERQPQRRLVVGDRRRPLADPLDDPVS